MSQKPLYCLWFSQNHKTFFSNDFKEYSKKDQERLKKQGASNAAKNFLIP